MDEDNDAQYHHSGAEKAGEPDTCRICRGEGDSEMLYHPCKCSGSIKFVHQDCLMEWLSHSQKKHCELCKTAFRFTKLYSPTMPPTLPLHVLIRHILIHTVKIARTLLRTCLVAMVWLGILPYTIRQVWRLLFWFSDGGWSSINWSSNLTEDLNATQVMKTVDSLDITNLMINSTSLGSQMNSNMTSYDETVSIVDRLAGFLIPTPLLLNTTISDYLVNGLLKSFYHGLGTQFNAISKIALDINSLPIKSRNSSLLGDISFFQNLTRNSFFNQLIINIAEGYIITVLVIVCFVLVFLIREWVVQQQPGINMGIGFNAEFAAHEGPRNEQQNPAPLVEIAGDAGNLNERGQDPVTHARRRNHDHELIDEGQNDEIEPFIPIRNASLKTAEIRKDSTHEPHTAGEFLDIWRRAEGEPKEAIRIIEAEGRSEELSTFLNGLKTLQNPTEASRCSSKIYSRGSLSSPDRIDEVYQHGSLSTSDNNRNHYAVSGLEEPKNLIAGSELTKMKSESHLIGQNSSVVANSLETDAGTIKFKGKSRAQDYEDSQHPHANHLKSQMSLNKEPLFYETSPRFISSELNNTASSSRPRSISDSPQRKGPSPLSTNSWSFPRVSLDKEGVSKLESIDKDSIKAKKTDIPNSNMEDNSEIVNSRILNSKRNVEYETLGNDNLRNFTYGQEFNKSNAEKPTRLDIMEQNIMISGGPESANNLNTNATDTIGLQSGLFQSDSTQRDTNSLETRDSVPVEPVPQNFLGKIVDFLWGEVEEYRPGEYTGTNDEAVQDLIDQAPLVPIADVVAMEQQNNNEDDREFEQPAIAAAMDPNDPDAIEDAEDFDGIMELLGMRGPLFSLIQNALFSALLLGVTVSIGVWTPYNIGRLSLLIMANPGTALIVPVRVLFGCVAFMQDLALTILGLLFSLLIQFFAQIYNLWSSYFGLRPSSMVSQAFFLASAATDISSAAFQNIKNATFNNVIYITDSEMSILSAACHESLVTIRNLLTKFLIKLGDMVIYIFTGNYYMSLETTTSIIKDSFIKMTELLKSFSGSLVKSDLWMISSDSARVSTPTDLDQSIWNGTDRFCAILLGYVVLYVLGALYVRKRSLSSSGQAGRNLEAVIIELLNQAGGVMKVILIISIEMLAFPLYCGLLLDIALLPLFENTTVLSRVFFTLKSPLTSIFVHWFVGTCYMFHFALFVSMCRKIMRKGVLYFIRDPDDPTFHPVRDVLERNVTTQLQKILFSALVYGGLILVCLGGVIWGISFAFKGVLPIHWSSNEPVMEFPIDLLFYNFLIPLAVKFFEPSTRLHAMYRWWFRQCARKLRLTWFMFDERKLDEEGHIVRKTWGDVLQGSQGDPYLMVDSDDPKSVFEKNPEWRAYYRKDGRYVRAPASDQVRIPKGSSIFLEVNEMNNRIDQKPDRNDGIHGKDSNLCKQVYIPPWFRLRISIFIFSIWVFAALTGVGITVIPLVLGRMVFAKIVPIQVHKNDAYAFSIGIYILGLAIYCVLHFKTMISRAQKALAIDAETPKKILSYVLSISTRAISITWTYTAFILILPTLFAFLIEFYLVIPLHTYFAIGERHVVHFVQSWTLGLLYVKLTIRLILWHENSRPAQSLRAIIRHGYLNPDARLATRSFILPGALLLSTALLYPWALARVTVLTLLKSFPEKHIFAYRYSYPVCLCLCALAFLLWTLTGWVKNWKLKVRDEVYLVGEQLHNFVERKIY